MCDYSLHSVLSREAQAADQLISTQFSGAATRGFAGVNDPSIAVCVLPGTEIAFKDSVRVTQIRSYDADLNGTKCAVGISPARADTVATFVQINKHLPQTHHDALLFSGGEIILVDQLEPGQAVDILTMPADPKTLHGKERDQAQTDQQRAEFV